MIGPLLCMAIANGFHARISMPAEGRYAGQWLVGSALGLYFSWPVITELARMAGWIALAVVLSQLLSLACSQVLSRVGGTDTATAFFASAVGGAAEMANQAERHGARVDQVAASQVVRVLFVVLTIPFLFKLLGLQGSDAYVALEVAFNGGGLIALLAGGLVCGAVLARAKVPNGWLFGPLLLSILLTASGHPLSSMPGWLINLGQLLIGCSLGARFSPGFFRDSPRYLSGVMLSGLLLLLGCSGIGLLVSLLSGIPLPTGILATAPGGIAEMALTAKVLQLGVPVVTAFHTARLIAVVLTAAPLYHWLYRRRNGNKK